MKKAFVAALALLLCPALLKSAVKRIIVFKFDGLTAALVEKYIAEPDPRTGRARLPWIERLFAREGTRLDNFYARGISLSAPSWALLDTGQHQIIRGNVEYDRWTLHAYDYLNFFPFYLNYSQKKQVDMPAVEVLDENGIPLLLDFFRPEERWQSFQLYQRGNDWSILGHSFPDHFHGRSPKQWFDEWQTGLEVESSVPEETEKRLIATLANDKVRYLDFFSGDYDHVAHLTNDPESQLRALQGLDALVGRIWTAAMAAPLGPETIAVIVSDHGMNTVPEVTSQGYSLVDWFTSSAGGGHHTITDRYPLSTFKLRGLDPFVHKVTNASAESLYLKGESQHYPTALLDLDGNERAAVQLRSSQWNTVQILLEQARDDRLSAPVRDACRAELRRWAAAQAPLWEQLKATLNRELPAVTRAADQAERESADRNPRERGAANRASGLSLELRRADVRAARLREELLEYRDFITAYDQLLTLPANARESLVPKESLGPANSLYELQNYVVGPAPGGPVLAPGGQLDLAKSFRRMDYFAALQSIHVRNQVQKGIGTRPVDFIAVALDPHVVPQGLRPDDLSGDEIAGAVWLYAGAGHQALILTAEKPGNLRVRYLPIANLRAQPDGSIQFDQCDWGPGFPLAIFEDDALQLPTGGRSAWLAQWHGESEWFEALHLTVYSNGLIGLAEQFRPVHSFVPASSARLSTPDRNALRDFEQLRRNLVQPDLEIFAANHWNFNARSFNPGGNHGSFLRQSTRSVLMFTGGANTGIPRGLEIRKPYDSLSFVPTIWRLFGLPARPVPLPGQPIQELLPAISLAPRL